MALIKMNIFSETLGTPVNINVSLPSSNYFDWCVGARYPYTPGMKYQTLWLLHGGGEDDSDWVINTSVLRYAEANKLAVVIAPALNSFYVDMAHGGRYFTFFTEELPLVCRTFFPLSDKREDNFIAGLSMGGAGAMSMALKRPDLYDTALCLSGAALPPHEIAFIDMQMAAFDKQSTVAAPVVSTLMREAYGDTTKLEGSGEDMSEVARQNVLEGKTLPRFLFACGGADPALQGVEAAHAFLKGEGYESAMETVPGYGHEWDLWDLYIRKAIYELLPLKRTILV
jgi:S-formylglutathione hydrolase FrmB